MTPKNRIEELRRIVQGDLLTDQPMKEYTSLKVGGPADVIVFPQDLEDLTQIIKYLREEEIHYFVLGNGTNLLVRDGGIRDVVISLSRGFRGVEMIEADNSFFILAGASVPLVALIRFSLDHSLSGLEFAAGIPGTVGGGLIMNAGGHFGEIKDMTRSITILNSIGEVSTEERKDLSFSYRSLQLAMGSIIVSAVFELKVGKREYIKEKVREILIKRKETQPLDLPNAGSIFKNPEGTSAGKLIDEAGLKGLQIGGAMVSKLHGNFILNQGNAAAKDIIRLTEKIREDVCHKSGIELQLEIEVIGEN